MADFRKKPVTACDLKKRIKVPDPVEEVKEGQILALVGTLERLVEQEAVKEKEACLRAGGPASTLTKQQRESRKSLLAREKEGELVILGTDKSGKRAVMSKELYIGTMAPHMKGDTVHPREEVVSQENKFNGAATQILRALRMGEDWSHGDRFKSAYSVSFNQVPSLNALVKDHKPTLNSGKCAGHRPASHQMAPWQTWSVSC